MDHNKRRKSLFYKSIFIAGILAILWEIYIYRLTLIELEVPFLIIFGTGALTTYFGLKDFQELFNYESRSSLYFWTFFQSTVSWGFLACSIFMLTNYYFADDNSQLKTYQIIERSSIPGGQNRRNERKPTFKIMYNGKPKELVFPHRYYSKMETYKSIELEVRDGFFGYDILTKQDLK